MEAKRRPRRLQELPRSSPRALGDQKLQFLKKWLKCRTVEQIWRSGPLWRGTWTPSWSPEWRPSAPWQSNLAVQGDFEAQLGSTSPTWSPTWRPSGTFNSYEPGSWVRAECTGENIICKYCLYVFYAFYVVGNALPQWKPALHFHAPEEARVLPEA